MSNQQEFPMKKGDGKYGLKSLFRHAQGSNNNRNAQPPQSKSFFAPIPPWVDLGQSGGISSEDDGEAGSSEILRASSESSVSASSLKVIKTSRKQRLCEKTKLIWQGLYKLIQAIEPIVPEPFDTPIKIFTAISDAAEARKYFDNEEDLKAMMERLSSRLVEANRALLRSDDYSIDVAASSKQLAECVAQYWHCSVDLCLQAGYQRGS
ncbi:hypothetical protein C8R45DRAFT_943687 [Mycena sanguinolenta]|nr:hypothetical protein C8R45DRAFT_943687 [Mycena sanguinolenta]